MAVPKSDLDALARDNQNAPQAETSQDRSTSASKEIPPTPEQTFSNAPSLDGAYREAQQSQQPLEQREEPTRERSMITAANQQDPAALKGTSLEKAPDMGTGFDNAANQNQAPNTSQQQGSEMVQRDQPQPYPKPQLPGAEAVDRASFDQRWQAEQTRASSIPNEDLRAVNNDLNSDKNGIEQSADRNNEVELE